jgi:hypothetical protein
MDQFDDDAADGVAHSPRRAVGDESASAGSSAARKAPGTRRQDTRVRSIVAGALIAATAALGAWANSDIHSPPRFDGAGYAVLAKALASGQGYREIDHPGAHRHAHFPPGYPATLAALWMLTGHPSVEVAHVLSLACTTAATVLIWRWFGSMYRRQEAWLLGVCLAVNWTWARIGGSIQSEPLYLLLESLAWLAAANTARQGTIARGVITGVALAACVLTRQVALMLVAAVVIDLWLSRRRSAALIALVATVVVTTPWLIWLAIVGERTQLGLLTSGDLGARLARQAVFYLQRLPDQLTGPIVEVGTVFQDRPAIAFAVTIWAAAATGLLLFGWSRSVRARRRRLAALSAFATLALLLIWPFTEAGRFLIPLIPCLLVGATEGLSPVLAWIGLRNRPRRLAALLVLGISLAYPVYAVATDRARAQRRTHEGFDAACAWITTQTGRAGPILTRHPGEVYWQTGRLSLAPDDDTLESIARAVDRWSVAYLVTDEARYARAAPSSLLQFARKFPERMREVWVWQSDRLAVRVFEVGERPVIEPRNGETRNPRSDGSSAGAAAPSS